MKNDSTVGVVLIGHGVPATDCPPELVGEMMGLEWRRGPSQQERIAQLDHQIRHWPRTDQNDPYKTGIEKLATALRPLLKGKLFAIGYNEFCSPTAEEAIRQVIQQGAAQVWVIPTMLTPGGLHSEKDIPRSIEKARASHPGVSIRYIWPFNLEKVAHLLMEHIEQAP